MGGRKVALHLRFVLGLLVSASGVLAYELPIHAAEYPCNEPRSKARVFRIIREDNKRANPADWPFIVSVEATFSNGQTALCGGSLIEQGWVVTAAHCVTFDEKPQFAIKSVGIDGRTGGDVFGVDKVIVYPNYKAETQRGDIALLKLKDRSSISDSSLAILATPTSEHALAPPETCAAVAGWGLTREELPGGVLQTPVAQRPLLDADLPIVGYKECSQFWDNPKYGASPIDPTSQVCAGVGGSDSCNGDSGGPLITRAGPNGFLLVGIVSFGMTQCGTEHAPGVYTRVAAFHDWIFQTISKN